MSRNRRHAATAFCVAASLAGCGGAGEAPVTEADREALAREAAPRVKSFLAKGTVVQVDGQPAVTVANLVGPGTGAVVVLSGRSRPGSTERQCTALRVRLVPSGPRGRELLPIVADAFEAAHGTTCGIP